MMLYSFIHFYIIEFLDTFLLLHRIGLSLVGLDSFKLPLDSQTTRTQAMILKMTLSKT